MWQVAFVTILLVVTMKGPAYAATIFDTDFETCTVGTGNDFPCEGWNDFGQEAVGHEEVVSGVAVSGSKSMKHTFTGTDAIIGNVVRPSIYRTLSNMEHIFLRVAIRHSPGFQVCGNGHTKLIRFRANEGNPLLWLYNRYGVYALVLESPFDIAGTYIVASGIAPSPGAFDQVEVEWKLNTPGQSNGLLRLWVNGVLRGEQLNKAYRGATLESKCGNGSACPSNASYDNIQVYSQCGLGTIHYDRIAVGDTRIFPIGGGGGGDSTPPAAPLGWKVE